MTVFIDNRSGQPIYEQIAAQIRSQILKAVLAPDEALPSIRSLAKDLGISVITTKRAYDELEAAGLLYTVPGKGSFVAAGNRDLLREERLRELEEHLRAAAAIARDCGIGREELREIYTCIEEETI
ncbi:MAG: GntR family transcriptional regulator [Oscillospiraceae bacterium]|nr:GntR family transcriptional regulator [Oscillospiraceae bacterium]